MDGSFCGYDFSFPADIAEDIKKQWKKFGLYAINNRVFAEYKKEMEKEKESYKDSPEMIKWAEDTLAEVKKRQWARSSTE